MKRLLPLLLACTLDATAAQDRPNFLWITSEDNSAWFIGCYGNPQARTPNLDRLASQGVRYTHAFANAPVCAVVRSTWITGVCAISTGTHNMRSRQPIPESIRPYPELLREAGYYTTNRSKTDYNIDGWNGQCWDECSAKAHYRNRKEGQPFFCVFNTTTSHESSIFPKKMNARDGEGPSPEEVFIPPHHPDLPGVRADWATYHQRVSAMDAEVGKILADLEADGLAEDTIVAYCSDHGGVLPRSKRFLYETGTRIPLIVRIPEKWRDWAPSAPGSTCEELTGFIDMPPTWLSLCGVAKPSHMQGRIFLGPKKETAPDHQFLFRNRMDERDDLVRAIRDSRYRYMRVFLPHRPDGQTLDYPFQSASWTEWHDAWKAGKCDQVRSAFWEPRPCELLFDVEADPWEIHNLAGDPAQAGRLAKMRATCLDEMRAKRDTGLIPEAMFDELRGDKTIMEYVGSDDYPFEEVLAIALLAGEREAAQLPKFQAAMTNKHPVIRYWGTVGCSVLADGAKPAAGDLRKLLADKSAPVRMTAAEALGRAGFTEEAVAALKKELGAKDDMVVLHALNALDQLGQTARLSDDEIQQIKNNKLSYSGRLAEKVGK